MSGQVNVSSGEVRSYQDQVASGHVRSRSGEGYVKIKSKSGQGQVKFSSRSSQVTLMSSLCQFRKRSG